MHLDDCNYSPSHLLLSTAPLCPFPTSVPTFGLSLTGLSCGGSTGSYSSQLSSWLLMESEGETVIVLFFAHTDSPTSLPGTVPNPIQRRPHEFDAGLPITSAAYFVLLLSFEWSFVYPDIALITSTAYV